MRGTEVVPGVHEPCTPSPAYVPGLPTDGAAMARYLWERNGDSVNSLAKDIYELVGETYVQPASLAAVFDAVAEIDGLTVVDHATDGGGRSGVGVRWTVGDESLTLVFEAGTHEFLGMAGMSSVVAQAVVDEVGQRG